MRVDQYRVDASAPQHGRSRRAGKPAADNGDIRVPHGPFLQARAIIAIK
jgi:hypothetical protein